MTPTQTKRMIEIMSKHGQDGWKIEQQVAGDLWVPCTPDWQWLTHKYRAVGPRKRVELKRGMEVVNMDSHIGLIASINASHRGFPYKIVWQDFDISDNDGRSFTYYRWPNGNGEWLPIEGEPEIISMEGVE